MLRTTGAPAGFLRSRRVESNVHWLDRAILFFGGKGGVGKSTCAAAYALLASEAGQRVLLVSTDPAHSVGDILGADLGPSERRISEHLWSVEIDPEHEANAYIDRVGTQLRRVAPTHMHAEVERQIEMARVSPGAGEAALFDRVAEIVLSADAWDKVVFDTAPTGHTLRLLSLPELLQTWMDGLLARRQRVNQLSSLWRHMLNRKAPSEDLDDPVERLLSARRRKFYQVRERLLDESRSAFIFVLMAERLPIVESGKAVAFLRRNGLPVGGLIVNRLLPKNVAEHPFLAARKEQEQLYLESIARDFSHLPRINLPLLPTDISGRESLSQIASYLAEEIAAV